MLTIHKNRVVSDVTLQQASVRQKDGCRLGLPKSLPSGPGGRVVCIVDELSNFSQEPRLEPQLLVTSKVFLLVVMPLLPVAMPLLLVASCS